MTVNGVKCGVHKLEHAQNNPKWGGEDDVPETIPLQAASGMEFCVVDATYTVTGKKPKIGWDDFDNLVTADGTEYAEDGDTNWATSNLNERLSGCAPDLCGSLNPGKKIKVVKVYQVPEGTKRFRG